MKLSFENNGTRLQLETPKQFDMATGTAFLALASKVLTGDEQANHGLTATPDDQKQERHINYADVPGWREISKPGHRDGCPLKSGGHYTFMSANDDKDLVSITERINLETGKYKDIDLHNMESKERNRIPFPYCPICGGRLYKKGDE